MGADYMMHRDSDVRGVPTVQLQGSALYGPVCSVVRYKSHLQNFVLLDVRLLKGMLRDAKVSWE